MMDIPLMEAAQILGIHYKRIQRAVHAGKIADRRPRPLPVDPHKRGIKYYLVNLEEAHAFCEKQGWLVEQTPPNETAAMILHLVQEVERLQRELTASRTKPAATRSVVSQDMAPLTSMSSTSPEAPAAPQKAPPVHPQRRPEDREVGGRPLQKVSRWADYQRITDSPELPPESSLIPLPKLVRAHGVAYSTATKQHETGVYHIEPQRYKVGRNADVMVIHPDQAWEALQYWWRRGQMREDLAGNCGIVNCPCLHLITDMPAAYNSDPAANYRNRKVTRKLTPA